VTEVLGGGGRERPVKQWATRVSLSVYPSVCQGPETQISFNKTVPCNFLPEWGWWAVGGEVFSFKLYLVWIVDFLCKFYLGARGRIYFPFSQWEGPRCLAFIPFKFGGFRRVMILFYFVEGGGGGGGVLGVLIGGSELEWEMRKTGWGGSTGCIMHRVHTSML